MSLSLETARKICQIIDSDADCRRVINDPFGNILLEQLGWAGSARNIALLAFGGLVGAGEGTDKFNDQICLGVALYTSKALIRNRSKLPEVRAASTAHRVHRGTHHEATWLRMSDESQYMFDWHATLNIYNPLISKFDDWQTADGEVPLIHCGGFD